MKRTFAYPKNFVRYLGTGGARFCMIRQMRWTGGIWFSYGGLNGVIDPGPGCLYHICSASPHIDVETVRAILLTHKHLDHSTDINVIVEAMTDGGFQKQGAIILPKDAIDPPDPVLLDYCAQKAGVIHRASDGQITELENGVTVEAVEHVHHDVDCFGYILRKKGLRTWGIISDTKLLPEFKERYKECDYISINTTFLEKSSKSEHMSIQDNIELLEKLHPRLVTISHMGIKLIKKGPDNLAKTISTPQTRVAAGQDGMVINLDNLKIFSPVKRKKRTRKKFKLIS